MPVNRLINQINLRMSDSVLLVYGQVNDTFITSDLTLYNTDGIEKIMGRYLRNNDYKQVIFYAPERQLYTYDKQSYLYCFPDQPELEQSAPMAAPTTPDSRPLGKKRYLNRSAAPAATVAGSGSTDRKIPWNKREGYIPIIQGKGDSGVVDIIYGTLFQHQHASAVIINHFDHPRANSEILRLTLQLVPRLQGSSTMNKLIFITNAIDSETLTGVIDSIPALTRIVKRNDLRRGLDSLIYIGYPNKDELRNLIHRERIMKGKALDWNHFERLITGLNQRQDELKRWEKELQIVQRIDINSVNKGLKTDPISEDEQSAFQKLDALVGLEKVKKALQRHLRQIHKLRKNGSHVKPLMHIVLKGNPGTGKTTLARFIAEIFREEGILERGHLVEVDRAKVVAGYIGQTAIKMDSCCREAFGGVLFIDEAYALAPAETSSGSQDFGKEAIDTLIKRMSDWQEHFCVILAGYPDDMERLLATNPGFSGRIGLKVDIDDYKPEELTELFGRRVIDTSKSMSEPLAESMLTIFTALYAKRGKKFDNARTVEQVFNQIDSRQIDRCDQHKLDSQQEPLQIEDVPDELAIYTKKPPVEGTAMERLNTMVGLEKAKEQIKKQLALLQARQKTPDYAKGRRLHMVFAGNPGTGKTTVARIMGEIYQHYGMLSNNVFIEASRQDLVGVHLGETAPKVERKFKEAQGGILFIDEVYTLINGDNDPYGREAVDTMLKLMEDNRGDLCVIIAGYPDKIHDFMDSNPGLKRRFSATVDFEDYTPDQLFSIFQTILVKEQMVMDADVARKMPRIFQRLYQRRDKYFGNAGEVENIIQSIQENHALRCQGQQLNIAILPIALVDLPPHLVRLLPVDNNDEVINNALKELNNLTGLSSVKTFVNRLVKEYKHDQLRRHRNPNLPIEKRNYHMIFKGNPGTGKTTVARLIGKLFKALDILKDGEVVEVCRVDFVASYHGQTAEKTTKLIERKAFDNILFIDEAYSLSNGMMDNFGEEAIVALLKQMEDHRDRFVVIAAGYSREMSSFLQVNSGLASRFPNQISFDDFDEDELVAIFKSAVVHNGYRLSDDVESELAEHLAHYKAQRGAGFGNARDIKNFLEQEVLPIYRDRIELAGFDPDSDQHWLITRDDFPKQEKTTTGLETKEEFSLAQNTIDQHSAAIAMTHSGSGANVGRDQIITHNHYYGKPDALPKELTLLPARQKGTIFGRDALITDIFNRLTRADSPDKLLIHGLPGIGKTKTVLKLLENHPGAFEHIVWLDVKGSLQKAFIENTPLLKNLGIDFTEKDDDAIRYNQVIGQLQKIDKTGLLIIDGLPKSSETEFQQLHLPKFKILATAREKILGGHLIPLNALEPVAAKALFTSIYDQIDVTQLDNLLKPVSYHPLTVELLARILMTNPNMSYDRLFGFVSHGLHVRKGEVAMSYPLAGGNDMELIEVFSTLFGLMVLSETEKEFLGYFSVLPAHPIPREMLYELFRLDDDAQKDRFNEAAYSLIQKGFLVEETSKGLFCYEIIQQVFRNEAKPSLDNCQALFEVLGLRLGEKIDAAINGSGLFALISDYLYILETFVTHFDSNELLYSRIFINLSILYRINGQFDQAITISVQELAALDEYKLQSPSWYNITLRNIAYANLCKGAYAEAERYYSDGVHFLESLRLDESEHLESIERELILNYSQLGIIELQVGKHDIPKAIDYFEKGLLLAENSPEKDPSALATLKEGLAVAQVEGGNSKLAIANLDEARELLTTELGIDKDALPQVSLDLLLAMAYASEKDFTKARGYASDGVRKLENHVPENNLDFYRAFMTSATVHLLEAIHRLETTGELDKELFERAEKFFLQAIAILEEHRGPDHEDLAILYCNHGLILKYLGKEKEGYVQHEKGLAICDKKAYKNDLIAAIYFRTIIFFENSITLDKAEQCLEVVLAILPDTKENQLDIALVNYYLGVFMHKNKNPRPGITALSKALRGVRAFYGKTTSEISENDSPLEVFFIQEMAAIHSELHDYSAAIRWQEEAVRLCEAHMDSDDEELVEPYVQLSKIYLEAAEYWNDKKWYADSLTYKVLAERLNPEIIQANPHLEDSGDLYTVETKDGKGVKNTQFVIIPGKDFPKFKQDFTRKPLFDLNLNEYGYVLPVKNDFPNALKAYTEKYGQLKDRFTIPV